MRRNCGLGDLNALDVGTVGCFLRGVAAPKSVACRLHGLDAGLLVDSRPQDGFGCFGAVRDASKANESQGDAHAWGGVGSKGRGESGDGTLGERAAGSAHPKQDHHDSIDGQPSHRLWQLGGQRRCTP